MILDEPPKVSLLYEFFNMLFQVVTILYVIVVIPLMWSSSSMSLLRTLFLLSIKKTSVLVLVIFKGVSWDNGWGNSSSSFLLHHGDLGVGADYAHSCFNFLCDSSRLPKTIAIVTMYWLTIWRTFGTIVSGLSINDQKRWESFSSIMKVCIISDEWEFSTPQISLVNWVIKSTSISSSLYLSPRSDAIDDCGCIFPMKWISNSFAS